MRILGSDRPHSSMVAAGRTSPNTARQSSRSGWFHRQAVRAVEGHVLRERQQQEVEQRDGAAHEQILQRVDAPLAEDLDGEGASVVLDGLFVLPLVLPPTVTGFAIDHRKVAPGTVFGAFQGTVLNGEDFIPAAVAAGAIHAGAPARSRLARTSWLLAPALAYVAIAGWTSIERDWFTIWAMWALMLVYLVAVVAIARRRSIRPTSLPPVWFVFALAFITAIQHLAPLPLRGSRRQEADECEIAGLRVARHAQRAPWGPALHAFHDQRYAPQLHGIGLERHELASGELLCLCVGHAALFQNRDKLVASRLPGIDTAAWTLFTFALGTGRRAEAFLRQPGTSVQPRRALQRRGRPAAHSAVPRFPIA